RTAEDTVAEARARADRLRAEPRPEADRHANAAQRRVDEANKQYETVQAHLAQISQLLGPSAATLSSAPAPALAGPRAAVAAAPATNGGGTAPPSSGRSTPTPPA